jgi:hypothetical protein
LVALRAVRAFADADPEGLDYVSAILGNALAWMARLKVIALAKPSRVADVLPDLRRA